MAVMNLSGDLVLSVQGGGMKDEIAENTRMHAIVVVGRSSFKIAAYGVCTQDIWIISSESNTTRRREFHEDSQPQSWSLSPKFT